MNVKAVCVDLDGTLLDSNSKLSPQNIRALQQFKDNGGLVIIATGRWRAFTVDLATRHLPGIVHFLVCSDGGLILQRSKNNDGDGWEILHIHMPTAVQTSHALSAIWSVVPRANVGIFPLQGQNIVSSQTYIDWLTEEDFAVAMFKARPPLVCPECEQVLLDGTRSHISWLRILPGKRGTTGGELLAVLQPVFDLEQWQLTVSDWTLKDGTGAVIARRANVNKAVGLQTLVEHGKIKWPGALEGRHFASFGDNWNDLEMLDWSEFSVAPANAPADKGALAHAKTISKLSNDESFVADFIEQLFSGKTEAESASSL